MIIDIDEAVHLLKKGEVVGVPTDTVYGLAASLNILEGILKVFAIKRRPSTNPLIIQIADVSEIAPFVSSLPRDFFQLTHLFWPGPLTFIVPVKEETISPIVRADLPTAGFRVPGNSLMRELLYRTGPLVVPSANLSGCPSATSAKHVEHDFGNLFPVLDGGSSEIGLESTLLEFYKDKWRVLRQGAVDLKTLSSALGYVPELIVKEKNVERSDKDFSIEWHLSQEAYKGVPETVLGFRDRTYSHAKNVVYMGKLSDPASIAESLYDAIREIEQKKYRSVWVDLNFPFTGLLGSIAERLIRTLK